jgi:peroxiredoxin
MMKFLIPLLAVAALAPALQETRSPKVKLVQVGQDAPHFRLNDQAGKAVTVGGESERWTVLAFFPKAATRG